MVFLFGMFAKQSTSAFEKQSAFGAKKSNLKRHLCLVSAAFAFAVGLSIGVLIPSMCFNNDVNISSSNVSSNVSSFVIDFTTKTNKTNSETEIKNVFVNNSFGFNDEFSTVSFVENTDRENDRFVEDGIFWGKKIEESIPKGFDQNRDENWRKFVKGNSALRLELGCGRMQNRLVLFENGFKGCIRYRQNIDQIQGELFSFYLGRILKLNNLAPSLVTVINLKDPFFKNIIRDISNAQWNSNKPIVLTEFIPNLDSANIPFVFKNNEKHLNKFDVKNLINENSDSDYVSSVLIELAQWSDLIIFDYLTANLDRVVNNLFNYQWNANIMEAPAHNLAKNSNNLLIFLDNESGLLHGYRLLQKYEKYHSILLDNLCLFRKRTVKIIRDLKTKRNIGFLLREMFDKENSNKIKDVLPNLPEKSVKILNERIDKVHDQIEKCELKFSDTIVR